MVRTSWLDSFLEKSSFTPCAVYHKDEPRFRSKPKGKVNDKSGLNVSVSEADFADLQGQIEDAISFLKQNKSELKRLRQFLGVEGVCLDFGIKKRDVIAQYDYFPPELLYLAGGLGIGIELSQYPAED